MKSPDEVKKKMGLYIKIENPDMEDQKIERCSTEHGTNESLQFRGWSCRTYKDGGSSFNVEI
jgi:hypothetical protein